MSNYPWLCLRWLFGFCSARSSKCAGFRVECRAFRAALPAATMRGQVAQSVEQRTENKPPLGLFQWRLTFRAAQGYVGTKILVSVACKKIATPLGVVKIQIPPRDSFCAEKVAK